MRRLLLFSVLFLLLTGALGLKTRGECNELDRVSHKIQCYHAAAISAAYLGDNRTAVSTCDDIWVLFGSHRDKDDDLAKKANLVSNTCFYDVAKIVRNEDICYHIEEQHDFGTRLFGDEVTMLSCVNETRRLALIAPENYYNDNPDNLCAMVFILPLLVFSVLGIRRDRP